MKKIKVLALLALLAFSPFLLGAGSSGFPSRPTFSKVTVTPLSTDVLSGSDGNIKVVAPLNGGGLISNSAVITIGGTANNPAITNTIATYRYTINGLRRWGTRINGDLETGGDAGSNFEVESFTDAGAHKDYPIRCLRGSSECDFSGTVGSTKACATGYMRVGPNFCYGVQATSVVNVTGSAACAQSTAPANLTDAKAVLMAVSLLVKSTNTLNANDVATLSFGTTTGCATVIDQSLEVHEFVALAATEIGRSIRTFVVPTNATGQFFFSTSSSAGSIVTATPIGYFD